MKEKETRKLYNSMTNVKEDYIEEARKAKAKNKQATAIPHLIHMGCFLLAFAFRASSI